MAMKRLSRLPAFTTALLQVGVTAALLFACTAETSPSLRAGQVAFAKGDYETSLEEWLPLAEQGHVVAQANIGYLYNTGYGVPQNYAEAAKWYRKAAEQEYAETKFNLGLMYQNGEGVPADRVMALMWYSLAAEQGYEEARVNRDWLTARMTATDISKAEELARKWSEGYVQED